MMHLIKQKPVFQQAVAPVHIANCVMEYIEDWLANSSNIG